MTRPPEPSDRARNDLQEQATAKVQQLDDTQRSRLLFRFCDRYPSMVLTLLGEFERTQWRYGQ